MTHAWSELLRMVLYIATAEWMMEMLSFYFYDIANSVVETEVSLKTLYR